MRRLENQLRTFGLKVIGSMMVPILVMTCHVKFAIKTERMSTSTRTEVRTGGLTSGLVMAWCCRYVFHSANHNQRTQTQTQHIQATAKEPQHDGSKAERTRKGQS